MLSFDHWPLWLQLVFGIPNAVIMTWLMVTTPKTDKGRYFAYGYLACIGVLFLIDGWGRISWVWYVIAASVAMGLLVSLWLRRSRA